MPRTKHVRSTARLTVRETEVNIKPKKGKVVHDMVDAYLKALENEVVLRKVAIAGLHDRLLLDVNSMVREQHLKFHSCANKTMAELKCLKPVEPTTICEISSFKNTSANTTKSSYKSKNQSSIESNNTLRSTSRSNIKKAKTTRASKSISRSKAQQMAMGVNSYFTPAHNQSAATTFGLVTPKVKPNTPQVVLRRPKQGEFAISMQGSPLMVSSVISDQKANVNIPLLDGRVLSIQPQRGLRTSQIPELDAETKRQIETLRDNLNKVCALTARR